MGTGLLCFTGAALLIPGILAILSWHETLPPWIVLVAAAGFAIMLAGETTLAMWYQNRRIRSYDLTETEGDPTDRAYLLLSHEEQAHELEVGYGKSAWGNISLTASPWSLPGLGMTFLVHTLAALAPGAAMTGLATLVHATTQETVASALATVIVSTVCGIVMLIRVEQLDLDSAREPGSGDA